MSGLSLGFVFRFQVLRDDEVVKEWVSPNAFADEGYVQLLSGLLGGGSIPSTFKMGLIGSPAVANPVRTNTLGSHPWPEETDLGARKVITFADPVGVLPLTGVAADFTNGSGSAQAITGAFITDDTVLYGATVFGTSTIQPGDKLRVTGKLEPSEFDPIVTFHIDDPSETVNICGVGNTARNDPLTKIIIQWLDPDAPTFQEIEDLTGSGGVLSIASLTPNEGCYRNLHGSINWPDDGSIIGTYITGSQNFLRIYYASTLGAGEWDLGSKVRAEST